DVHELRRGNVVWEHERLVVPHQDRGPEQSVEHDVVLSHEVVVLRGGVVPPLLPPVRLAPPPPALPACREVPHHGLEPHVDPLRFPLGARERELDPPVDVPGEGSVLETLVEPRSGELEDWVARVALTGDSPLPAVQEP